MGTHYLSIVLGFCERKRGKSKGTEWRKENLLSRACSSLFNGTLIIYDPEGSFGVTFFRKIIKRLSLGFSCFLWRESIECLQWLWSCSPWTCPKLSQSLSLTAGSYWAIRTNPNLKWRGFLPPHCCFSPWSSVFFYLMLLSILLHWD